MAPSSEPAQERPFEAVIDKALEQSDGDEITFSDFLSAWGDRSYGPLFIILGVIGGTPLSVVPGAAAVVGLVILVLALQMAFGRTHPWLPRWITRRSIKEETLRRVRKQIDPVLGFLDNLITERLVWAAGEFVRRIAALVVAALAVIMAPLDAVPFAVAAPAWGVALFGVAITARDGLVMLLALAAAAGIAWLSTTMML